MLLRACVLLALCPALASGGQQLLDRVLARVGSHAITQTDVQAAISLGIVTDGPRESALDHMIARYLALTEIERSGRAEPDAARVEDALARMKMFAGARLPAIVQSTGADDPRLRELARETVVIESYLEERFPLVPASEIDAMQYYKAHPEEFRRGGMVVPFEEALAEARTAAANERRQARIAQWTSNLRDRIEVTRSR